LPSGSCPVTIRTRRTTDSDDNNHSFYTDLLTLRDGQTVDLTAGVFHRTRTIALRADNAPMPEFRNAAAGTYTSDWRMPQSPDQSSVIPINNGPARPSSRSPTSRPPR
jgi:hypothetical protein